LGLQQFGKEQYQNLGTGPKDQEDQNLFCRMLSADFDCIKYEIKLLANKMAPGKMTKI